MLRNKNFDSNKNFDATDAEIGIACRKYNIGTPAKLDQVIARLRELENMKYQVNND